MITNPCIEEITLFDIQLERGTVVQVCGAASRSYEVRYVMRNGGGLADSWLLGASVEDPLVPPSEEEMKHFEPYPLGYFQIDWKRFGELVKLAREENKFSLRGMADFTGISAATLCRCERGESVEPDHFFTLLQVLGLPFEIPEEVTKPA